MDGLFIGQMTIIFDCGEDRSKKGDQFRNPILDPIRASKNMQMDTELSRNSAFAGTRTRVIGVEGPTLYRLSYRAPQMYRYGNRIAVWA